MYDAGKSAYSIGSLSLWERVRVRGHLGAKQMDII
jgi:hypothetical protein